MFLLLDTTDGQAEGHAGEIRIEHVKLHLLKELLKGLLIDDFPLEQSRLEQFIGQLGQATCLVIVQGSG